MKLLTRDADYAVRALCFIAKKKDSIVSVKELVKSLRVPRPFIRKILQILNKKGLLKSYKGKGGGFVLGLMPRDITLRNIIEVFQGLLKFSEHNFKKRMCPEVKRCPLKKRLDAIERFIKSELDSITIEYLLKKRRG